MAQPHRRLNALTGDRIVVSPHRATRPWLGAQEAVTQPPKVEYDPGCYLCPGNPRSGGKVTNEKYEGTWVFDNDFAALLTPEEAQGKRSAEAQLQGEGEGAKEEDAGGKSGDVSALRERLLVQEDLFGVCRVGCFSPRHDLALAASTVEEVRAVVDMWSREYTEIGAKEFISYVQVFENKGEMMGCSNPHPHCQFWATSSIPQEPMKELKAAHAYRQKHESCLLCDYLRVEEAEPEARTVYANDSFVVLVPYWALWPFETLVVAREHVASLPALDEKQLNDFADAIRTMACKYDNMFGCAFPYSMGIHQAPTDSGLEKLARELGVDATASSGSEVSGLAHLHAHFYPPLLRSATVRKFMVGFEMLAEPQRDITAEISAARLRDLDGTTHYSAKLK